MPLPTDPLLSSQWHLINTTPGLLDLNVAGVWNPTEGPAYTGAGTWTVVIDDGFDYLHSDLAPNYHEELDYDFDGANDLDPFGLDTDAHGTAVTGIIGAAANGSGAVGIAYDTELIGYRVEGLITDAWLTSIAEAISNAATNALADLVNISQGIANDLNSEFGTGYTASLFDDIETAIGTAVNTGRNNLGTIIIKSAGNSRGTSVGASNDYDVNADDWTNDTRQVVVAAVDQDGFISSYSSYGAAVLVSAFGTPGEVVTTDRSGAAGYDAGDFTSTFNGTSSAAPMVSGVVSLMLEANAGLGWRDVQTILANTARQVGSEVGSARSGFEFFDWGFNAASTWNGGGLHFSNDYGYGLVDALAAVRLSETWLFGNQTAQTTTNQFTNNMDMLNVATVIPDGNATGLTFTGNAAFDDFVERVTVTLTFSTTFMGDLELYLISPDGTTSILLRDQASGLDFNGSWTFETQAFRGERAAGQWSVRIVDDVSVDVLTVSDIVVTTYGIASSSDRYVYTNEYSDYAGLFGHVNNVTDTNGGTNDVANASAVTTASTIRLDGVAGAIDGIMTTFTGIEHAVGGDGNDTIYGDTGNNMLYGMRSADLIYGGNGSDSLYGGTGADVLAGGVGNDVMEGGDGNDTYYVDSASDTILDIGGALDTIYTGVATYSIAAIGGVERLIGSLTTGQNLTGNAINNLIYANTGNDTLNGNAGNDSLYGGNGNDVLAGGIGNDLMDGGLGDDTYWVDSASDTIADGGGALDTVYTGLATYSIAAISGIERLIGTATSGQSLTGNSLNNLIYANTGNDAVTGNAGNDSLYGGDGNDVLAGGVGNDLMNGGLGDDTYWVDSLTDTVIDGGGALDTVYTGLATYSIGTVAGIERLIGTAGTGQNLTGNTLNNLMYGNAGNDTLIANAGNDSLYGGNGNDVLAGGAGNDVLTGGGNNDAFVFNTALGASNIDTIVDFSVPQDTIRLENAIFTALTATGVLGASAFALGAAATTAAQRIIYNNTTGALFYDADGVGGAAQIRFATLNPGLAMTAADFLVI